MEYLPIPKGKNKTKGDILKMSRNKDEFSGITRLGNRNESYPDTYAPEMLEAFSNKHTENDYMVTFKCPEFTTLCPLTGQPDFAEILINYIPGKKMVESKSLKLYLFSFRNNGDFHEDCVNIIMKDLVALLSPRYLEVKGIFTPRGGISIYPFANYAPKGGKYEAAAQARLFASLDGNAERGAL
jgi:7-cyano-7-deazaguanine reductase